MKEVEVENVPTYDSKVGILYQCIPNPINYFLVKFNVLFPEGITPRYSWSRQGNAIIILGEHRFKKRSKHINQKHETHWVCNKCDKGCKAKLTTLKDAIIKMYNIHDHRGLRKAK